MNLKLPFFLLVVIFLGIGALTPVFGALITTFNSNPPNSGQPGFRNGDTYWLGIQFTPNADTVINALGFLDVSNAGSAGAVDPTVQDGLLNAHTIYLYQQGVAGAIASAVVPSGSGADFLDGQFRYTFLASSVTLTNGANYQLLANPVNDWVRDFGGLSTATYASWATNVKGLYQLGNTNTPPTQYDPANSGIAGDGAYITANLMYLNPVPEPSVYALLFCGTLLTLICLRKKRHAPSI